MTAPRSSRELALGILLRVDKGAHAAPLLDARGRELDARDRDFLRALVKKTLRGAIRLDHVIQRHLKEPAASLDPPVLAALRLGAAQLLLMDRVPAHAAVGETVAAVRIFAPKAAGLVNAVLRRVAEREKRPGAVRLPPGADPLARLALETSHPEWLVSDGWPRSGSRPHAPRWRRTTSTVRPTFSPTRARVRRRDPRRARGRRRDGGEIAVGPARAHVTEGNAAAHPLVSGGALAVVDAAAQALAALLPEARVAVDLTAAPGGKARTLLASGRARRVVALERTASRAARLAANLAAAGRRDEVLVVRADAGLPPLPRERFDAVLLDAPCSGTGTLRKNPEIRLRLGPGDFAGFAATQRRLLDAALALLAPGGALLYVTCSLEPEENEHVVDALLAARQDFVRIRPELTRRGRSQSGWMRPASCASCPARLSTGSARSS